MYYYIKIQSDAIIYDDHYLMDNEKADYPFSIFESKALMVNEFDISEVLKAKYTEISNQFDIKKEDFNLVLELV